MMPFSSNVRASGSSWSGSSCCSSAVATNWRISAVNPLWNAAISSLTGPGRVPISRTAPAKKQPPGNVCRARWSKKASQTATSCAQPGRGGQRRFDDLGVEDPPGFVHGGELELLLRAEVGVDAALAHAEGAGEVADRQAFEAVDRRERHRLPHDRVAGAFTVGARLPGVRHVDKIARSVVLSGHSTTDRAFFGPDVERSMSGGTMIGSSRGNARRSDRRSARVRFTESASTSTSCPGGCGCATAAS